MILIVCSRNLLEHIGMRADRALAENHQRARQNVRAFHGDCDRHLLIETTQIIVLAETNALATMHVHRIVDQDTVAFCSVVFDDRRDHRRLLAHIYRQRGELTRGIDHIGVRANACQRLFDALELSDRHMELLAYPAIRASGACNQFHAADTAGRKRDRATCRQTFHQHAPALAHACCATDDVFHRNKHILALRRTVQERGIQREMAAPYPHPRRVGRYQRERDAKIGFTAEQTIGIIEFECEAKQRRRRRQCDVTFLPGQAHAQHILPSGEFSVAHHTVIGYRTGIGTGEWPGQCEARHFLAFGESVQIFIFLRLCSVLQQQFCRPE